MNCADFINTIVVDILDKSLSSHKNYELGGSYNTFRQCIDRNKNIGKKPIIMITNMINREIYDIKKNKAIEFLKDFLTHSELEYMKNNPNDIKSLVTFAAEKVNEKINTIVDTDNFKIVDIFEWKKLGKSVRDYVIEAIKLGYETIENLTEQHGGEIEQLTKMISKHPANRRILLDKNNNFIGYWSIEPLFENIFVQAKNGELFDNELTADKIAIPVPGSTYNAYFSSICLKEDYRKMSAFKILFFSLIEYFEKLATEEIYFNEICTLAYSTYGESLCKTMGLQLHKKHIDHGNIYCGYVYDLIERPFCKKSEKVKNLYREFKNKKSHSSS